MYYDVLCIPRQIPMTIKMKYQTSGHWNSRYGVSSLGLCCDPVLFDVSPSTYFLLLWPHHHFGGWSRCFWPLPLSRFYGVSSATPLPKPIGRVWHALAPEAFVSCRAAWWTQQSLETQESVRTENKTGCPPYWKFRIRDSVLRIPCWGFRVGDSV